MYNFSELFVFAALFLALVLIGAAYLNKWISEVLSSSKRPNISVASSTEVVVKETGANGVLSIAVTGPYNFNQSVRQQNSSTKIILQKRQMPVKLSSRGHGNINVGSIHVETETNHLAKNIRIEVSLPEKGVTNFSIKETSKSIEITADSKNDGNCNISNVSNSSVIIN